MLSTMLKGKIHWARVTDAHLNYEGSLTIDQDLMEIVRILPFEKILVANLENGNRFETYAIPGKRGSGTICLNGATAHLGATGDRLTIFTFGLMDDAEAAQHQPRILRLEEGNRPSGALLDR